MPRGASGRTKRGSLAVGFGLAGVLILVCTLVGCSSQDGASSTGNPQRFDQKVLKLPEGASLDDVKSTLGEPVSEVTAEGEVTLIYKSWLLHFQKDELRQRVRETRTGKTSLSGSTLDRKVLFHLTPGMTVRAVKKILGIPEVYEQVYESARKPALILRYAYWELYFQRHRLVRRTQN
jgi:outer membrane protein assembly factor BamE (lipoprotein component of BamABCDE complex)